MIDFYELLEEMKKVQIKLDAAAEGDPEKEREALEAAKKAIGAQILHYRKHGANITQEELAHRLGVTKMQIIRWEAGKNMPSKLAQEKMKELGIIK